ncbi:hypothetical protein DFH29DRAFT_878343 [Suillus ampliporus]|nr:hypothetical protein DFH29DRAFT_878343 [Suillus ampliporus]
MEDFSNTLETISGYIIIPEFILLLAFQAIQQFKSLPDFLMFPVFLALRDQDQDHSSSALPQVHCPPYTEIIHAMTAFVNVAKQIRKESRSASDALKYACQNWAVHLSRAPNPWNNSLNHVFKTFWNHHLLSWLKRQWCLKGLRSCLLVLSEMQKFAKPRPIKPTLRHSPSTPPAPLPKPNTTVSDAGTSRKRKQGEPRIDHDSPPLTDNESVNPIPSNRPKRDRQSLRPRGGESKRASKQCKKKSNTVFSGIAFDIT